MSHSLAALPAAVPAPGTGRRTWRAGAALLRASWMTAVSYRAQLLFSLLSLLVTVIPMYFVAGALQPTMAGAIAREGGHYFGFLVIGTAGLLVIQAATMAFSTAIGGRRSSFARWPVIDRQIRPRACLAMKLICSGVANWAGMMTSPSFSRSSASTRM